MNDIPKAPVSEENETKVAIIENILMRQDLAGVFLGDIFLDQTNVTFIPYGTFNSSAPIVSGAAAVFGGVMGIVANTLLEGTFRTALPRADMARTADWGLPIIDRIKKHKGVVSLRRSEIQNFETEGGLVIEVEGGKHIFGYAFPENAAENSHIYREWYSDRLTSHPSAAKAGLGIMYPPPQVLLNSILENNPLVKGQALEVLAKDKYYMNNLKKIFSTTSAKKRQKILELWRDEPQSFKSEIINFLSVQGKGGNRLPIVSFAVLILACAGIAYAVHGILWLSGHENELVKGSFKASGIMEIGLGVVSLIAGFCSLVGIGTWQDKRAYLQQLDAFDDEKHCQIR